MPRARVDLLLARGDAIQGRRCGGRAGSDWPERVQDSNGHQGEEAYGWLRSEQVGDCRASTCAFDEDG